MPSIEPTASQFSMLMALPREQGPLEMLSLLRFRESADYAVGGPDPPCSGGEAYARYARDLTPCLDRVGARVVWHGTPLLEFISPTGESWDLAVIARFPTAAAFVELVTGTCYQAVSRHRRAALLDSRLIVTQARGVF